MKKRTRDKSASSWLVTHRCLSGFVPIPTRHFSVTLTSLSSSLFVARARPIQLVHPSLLPTDWPELVTHLVDRSFDISVPLERDGRISTVAIGSPSVCFESDSDRSRESYEALTVVTFLRNDERKEPAEVAGWLVLAWPTSLDPSCLLAYLMTSFLCGARNVAWSKHVAMSGSVRCGTHQCSCQVCCRNWERKREREKLSTLNYHRVSTMKIHSRYSHPWNLVDSIDHEDREIWSQVDTFLFLGSTRLSKHPVTLYIYIYIDQVR